MNRMHKCIAMALLAITPLALAGDEDWRTDDNARTIIGPSNPELYSGAQALLAGDFNEGIRLTRLGLDRAYTDRERQAGLSNLCAGYLRLEQWETALDYCDQALQINARNWRALNNRALLYIELERYSAAKRDLDLAGEVAPNSSSVKAALALYLDATEPVVPNVEIDDRRRPATDQR